MRSEGTTLNKSPLSQYDICDPSKIKNVLVLTAQESVLRAIALSTPWEMHISIALFSSFLGHMCGPARIRLEQERKVCFVGCWYG